MFLRGIFNIIPNPTAALQITEVTVQAELP